MSNKILGKEIEVAAEIGSAGQRGIKKSSANIDMEVEYADNDAYLPSIVESTGRRVTQKWVEGELSSIVHVDLLGHFLYNIYGDVTSTEITDDEDLSSGAYEHEFSLDDTSIHEALDFYFGYGTIYKATDCHIDTLDLSVDTEGYFTYDLDFVGKELIEEGTIDYKEEFDFVGRDVGFTVADDKSGLDSSETIDADELDISFGLNVARKHVLGQYEPKDIYMPQKAIEITITRDYDSEDDTFRDLRDGDDYKYMRITAEGQDDDWFSDEEEDGYDGETVRPKMEIDLYKAQVTDYDRPESPEEYVQESITVKGFLNENEGNGIGEQSRVVLVNKIEDYKE